MPSPSASKYEIAANKARVLRETAMIPQVRSTLSRNEIQIYYHSSLATFVAAWEAYIEVGSFFVQLISVSYSAISASNFSM